MWSLGPFRSDDKALHTVGRVGNSAIVSQNAAFENLNNKLLAGRINPVLFFADRQAERVLDARNVYAVPVVEHSVAKGVAVHLDRLAELVVC
jgi:hypothetical protein